MKRVYGGGMCDIRGQLLAIVKHHIRNILLAIFLFGCATDKQTTSNECVNFDDLELVVDKFLLHNSEFSGCARKIQGKYTVELLFDDGKKNGFVKQFENNILIEEGTFKDNLLDGEYKTFDLYGNLKSSTFYKNGLKNGANRIYWETGELGHIYHYSQDELIDTSYSYYRNGKKLARSIHHKGFGNTEEINFLDSSQTNFMSGSMRNGMSVGNWIYKFSSDSCFIRHYETGGSYTQVPCNCATLTIPKI
jgi:antitoxin component YwqK of YwqJK toxin-antitoxin module